MKVLKNINNVINKYIHREKKRFNSHFSLFYTSRWNEKDDFFSSAKKIYILRKKPSKVSIAQNNNGKWEIKLHLKNFRRWKNHYKLYGFYHFFRFTEKWKLGSRNNNELNEKNSIKNFEIFTMLQKNQIKIHWNKRFSTVFRNWALIFCLYDSYEATFVAWAIFHLNSRF